MPTGGAATPSCSPTVRRDYLQAAYRHKRTVPGSNRLLAKKLDLKSKQSQQRFLSWQSARVKMLASPHAPDVENLADVHGACQCPFQPESASADDRSPVTGLNLSYARRGL